MDLPVEDDSAGLQEYARVVVAAIGGRRDPVVVAQSFGGYVAPIVCAQVPSRLMVLIGGMVPSPGESAEEMFASTGYRPEPREDASDIEVFYQDVPPDLVAEALKRGRHQSEARVAEPSPLRSWPDVPTRVLICRDDRLFPVGFLRRVARERLGVTTDEIDGGHTPALSRPNELADRLEAYAVSVSNGSGDA